MCVQTCPTRRLSGLCTDVARRRPTSTACVALGRPAGLLAGGQAAGRPAGLPAGPPVASTLTTAYVVIGHWASRFCTILPGVGNRARRARWVVCGIDVDHCQRCLRA